MWRKKNRFPFISSLHLTPLCSSSDSWVYGKFSEVPQTTSRAHNWQLGVLSLHFWVVENVFFFFYYIETALTRQKTSFGLDCAALRQQRSWFTPVHTTHQPSSLPLFQVHKYWDTILKFFFASMQHHNGFERKGTRCALTSEFDVPIFMDLNVVHFGQQAASPKSRRKTWSEANRWCSCPIVV